MQDHCGGLYLFTMATSNVPHSTAVPPPSMLRVRRSVPMQLSQQDADALHALELDAIPRRGGDRVASVQAFCTKLDDVVLYVQDLREIQSNEGRSDWWHMADLLDDVADLRTAVQGDSWRGVVVKLVPVNGPTAPTAEPSGLAAQAAQAKLFALKNLQLCAGPSIDSPGLYLERLEGAVHQTEGLWRAEVEDGRSEAWKMADVLSELLDLLDAVRPNAKLGTQPTLRVQAP